MVAKCSTDPQSKAIICPIPPEPPPCAVKPGAVIAICADEPAPSKPVSHKSKSVPPSGTPKIKKTAVAAAPPRINSVSVKASELPEELNAILELQVPKKESPDGSAGFGDRFAHATQQARNYKPALEDREAPDARRFAGAGSYTKKLRRETIAVAGDLPAERVGLFRTPSLVGKQGTFTYGRVLDMRSSKDREELIRLQKGAHSPEQKMTPIRLTFYNEGDVTTETIPLASISKEYLYGIW
jgi:pyruvate/2-oxoglutarate dehydrogenase complex dihydrolipoamide acyltransferase (E2) component